MKKPIRQTSKNLSYRKFNPDWLLDAERNQKTIAGVLPRILSNLSPDEFPEGAILTGAPWHISDEFSRLRVGGHHGCLLATNKRLLYVGGGDMGSSATDVIFEEYPYDKIQGFALMGRSFVQLRISVGGELIEFGSIEIYSNYKKFIYLVGQKHRSLGVSTS